MPQKSCRLGSGPFEPARRDGALRYKAYPQRLTLLPWRRQSPERRETNSFQREVPYRWIGSQIAYARAEAHRGKFKSM
jgi:hypothetical protein